MKILFRLFYIVFSVLFLGLGNLFPFMGYQVMVVTSGSMEPTIKTGSVVVVHEVDDYQVGEIITYYERGQGELSTTHRIFADKIVSDEVVYLTKGDANEDVDEGFVKEEYIVGKVIASAPGFGYVLSMAKTWYGFLLLVGLPFVLAALEDITKILNVVRKAGRNIRK